MLQLGNNFGLYFLSFKFSNSLKQSNSEKMITSFSP